MGVGGAMDLVVGAKRVIITMTHVALERRPEDRARLHLSADGARVRGRGVTDLAVFRLA